MITISLIPLLGWVLAFTVSIGINIVSIVMLKRSSRLLDDALKLLQAQDS